MPRKYVLSKHEYDKFVAIPEDIDEIIRYYTLSEADIVLIRQHRGNPQRFEFAFLLCAMRYPGVSETVEHFSFKLGTLWETPINQMGTSIVSPVRRDAVYVLDGLLYHNSNLNIEEHYTDTAGFTDHIFAMMHFLGFRFAPRIRDFTDKKLYIPKNFEIDSILEPMAGGRLNTEIIQREWAEILRLHASLRLGTVTASIVLHKLNSYQRQNSLNKALKELGRIERRANSFYVGLGF